MLKNGGAQGMFRELRFGAAKESDDHRILSGEFGNRYQTGAEVKK
jgi:hypothetical protein